MRNNNYNSKSGKGKGNDVRGGSNESETTNSRGNRRSSNKSGNRSKGSNNNTNTVKTSVRGIGPSSYLFAMNEQSLRDTGNLSFSYATGQPFDINSGFGNIQYQVPGIMVLDYVPTIGVNWGEEAASPINVCAKALYAAMWAKRTGASTAYDPADVMLYAIGLANYRIIHTHLRRALGVAATYNPNNRYMPTALLRAMGFSDPEEIIFHQPRFRTLLNYMADAMSSFAIPTGIPILNTWNEMAEAVYLDAESDKAQMYLYFPKEVFCIAETDENGTSLERMNTREMLTSLDQLEEEIKAWTDVLLSSQDFVSITGDLRRTFDGDIMMHLPLTDEDYRTPFIYDPTVLVTIANSTIVGSVGDITQGADGNITQTVVFAGGSGSMHYTKDIILNFPQGEVTPEMIFMGTRGTCLPNGDLVGTTGVSYSTVGAYALTGISIISSPWSDQADTMNWTSVPVIKLEFLESEVDNFSLILKLSNFAFHPVIQVWDIRDSKNPEFIYFGNIHNYTVLSGKELKEINRVYMMAQFGLPYLV